MFRVEGSVRFFLVLGFLDPKLLNPKPFLVGFWV